MSSMLTHAMAGFAVGAVAQMLDKRQLLRSSAALNLGGVAAVGLIAGIIPDLDVFPLTLKLIRYESFFGHRGFFHSPLFYLLLAPIWALRMAKGQGNFTASWWRWTTLLFVALMSHSILDALTNGGLGVMLYFPFDSNRHFFSWQPIEVAPISLTRFLSARGIKVLLSELWFFIPLMLLAIWASKNTEKPASEDAPTSDKSEAEKLAEFMIDQGVVDKTELAENQINSDNT